MKSRNTRRGVTQTQEATYRSGFNLTQDVSKPKNIYLLGHALTYNWKDDKANLIDTPSSALRASSPSRGKWTRAFTLIELLVVVLIIGILAAVALPQYQKAVAKSRGVQIATFFKEARQAVDLYILEHGYEDKTFYKIDSFTMTDTNNHLDLLTPDLSALVDTLTTQYGFTQVFIGLWEEKETMVYIQNSSIYNMSVGYSLYNGEWSGFCAPGDSVTQGICETVHQAIPEIIID